MQFIDVIKDYLRNAATPEEIKEIKNLVAPKEAPPIDKELLLRNLKQRCSEGYSGENKLEMVKLIKDCTAWGLKDSKEWFEDMLERGEIVTNNKRPF